MARGFRGYLASIRSEEDRCRCVHVKRSHAMIYGPRSARYGGPCKVDGCDCQKFRHPPHVRGRISEKGAME